MEACVHNKDLTFPIRQDTGALEIHMEDICAGDIVMGGTVVDLGDVGFTLDDLRTIITKAEEVQKYGKKPPVCEMCGGTPFFPNEKPACPQWDKHICKGHIHTRHV